MKHNEEEWIELCRQASVEQDPKKLYQLVCRINELLEAKAIEKRLRSSAVTPPSKGNGIFQIAYDEMLLITRAELLKNRGYEVKSVLGNDDAKRVLNSGQTFRLFIVGHAAPPKTREEMVRWLKANFPNAKILALNPVISQNFKRAVLTERSVKKSAVTLTRIKSQDNDGIFAAAVRDNVRIDDFTRARTRLLNQSGSAFVTMMKTSDTRPRKHGASS